MPKSGRYQDQFLEHQRPETQTPVTRHRSPDTDMQAAVQRMVQARTRGQHREASAALVEEVRVGIRRSREVRDQGARDAQTVHARGEPETGAVDKREAKEKAEPETRENSVDTMCPVCLVDDAAREPCGALKGLSCSSGHAVCIDCVRKLVKPCAPGCQCSMKMHYPCPICRVQCSISPYHAMALIKGNHVDAHKTLARAGIFIGSGGGGGGGGNRYSVDGGGMPALVDISDDDDESFDIIPGSDDEEDEEYEEGEEDEEDEEDDDEELEIEPIPMDQETFESVQRALAQAGANVEFVVRRSPRNAAHG